MPDYVGRTALSCISALIAVVLVRLNVWLNDRFLPVADVIAG
ncbi:hypothetical protein [Pantoea ananatis]|nr:hypothetical protein [Pantoea ananatis]